MTGMASAICLPTSTRSSCACVAVQAGAQWRPCLLCLSGPCRFSWEAFTLINDRMGGPWMQPGPNLVDTHLGLMVSSFKHVGIGNGTTRCSTSLLEVQGRSVGCARPARRAGLPSPSVVPQQLGELQGTQMPNFWQCNSRRTSLPVACLAALGLALRRSALVPCIAWMLVSLQTSLAASCGRLCCGWGCLEGPRNSGSFLSGE